MGVFGGCDYWPLIVCVLVARQAFLVTIQPDFNLRSCTLPEVQIGI